MIFCQYGKSWQNKLTVRHHNFFSLSKKIERHKQNQVTIILCLEKESETSFIGNSEMVVNNEIESIDRDEIGKEIGIIDVQMDNQVDQLTSDGYMKKID